MSVFRYVPVGDAMFFGRANRGYNGAGVLLWEVAVPDGLILCDICNTTINDPDWPADHPRPKKVALLGTWAYCDGCTKDFERSEA